VRGAAYLCLPEPLRGVSLAELEELSFEELSFGLLSLAELSFDELSFDGVSDLGLSSFLSFGPESPPEDPCDEPFFA